MTAPSTRGRELADPTTVVVLVSAPWAGPSRPAPTVLRELARRWGERRTALLVEEPAEEFLTGWEIEVLPTWLLLERAPVVPEGAGAGSATRASWVGSSPTGEDVVFDGTWKELCRLTGAHPKHVIDAELGPDADLRGA